jgi:hypothetical protein
MESTAKGNKLTDLLLVDVVLLLLIGITKTLGQNVMNRLLGCGLWIIDLVCTHLPSPDPTSVLSMMQNAEIDMRLS